MTTATLRLCPDPDVQTLGELIERRGVAQRDRRAVVLVDSRERDWPMTYGEVLTAARRVAAGLGEQGLVPGDRVMIMLPSGSAFLSTFFGTVLAGGIPVPLYPPHVLTEVEDFLGRFEPIALNCQAAFLVTFKDVRFVAAAALARVKSLRAVLVAESFEVDDADFVAHRAEPHDTCFLQYTSGSAGIPKGVELTHCNVLANLYGIGVMVEGRPSDVTVSWLPMYHDMGLIGGLLCSYFWTVPLVLLSPQQFVKYPVRWLRAISRFGGTVSPAPNFAYRLCLRVPDSDLAGLNLSTWRVAFNGAEPVDVETLHLFTDKLAPLGFRPTTPYPVYGLAEATLAVTHPPTGTLPLVEYVERDALAGDGTVNLGGARGVARRCARNREDAVACVSVGAALPYTELRVTTDAGVPLPDRAIGEIRVCGPAVMKGYWQDPERTAQTLVDGWLLTGDLGFLLRGHLFVTGRKKDLIIQNGRNFYPQDFEDPVRRLEGVRKSGVLAVGARGPLGTEQIVLLVETEHRSPNKRAELKRAITEQVVKKLGVSPDRVEILPPRSILKTSSGKVRRLETLALLERGELAQKGLFRTRLALVFTAMRSTVQLVRLSVVRSGRLLKSRVRARAGRTVTIRTEDAGSVLLLVALLLGGSLVASPGLSAWTKGLGVDVMGMRLALIRFGFVLLALGLATRQLDHRWAAPLGSVGLAGSLIALVGTAEVASWMPFGTAVVLAAVVGALLSRGLSATTKVALTVVTLGLALDLFAHRATPAAHDPNDVRERMLRLALVAAVALPVFVLLFAELRGRAALGRAGRFAELAMLVGAVGLPLVLCGAAYGTVVLKYALPIPADAVSLGVGIAAWLTWNTQARAEALGWLVLAASMGLGLLMGGYAFDGPLPSPLGAYGDAPRLLARNVHVLSIVLGTLLVRWGRATSTVSP
jgi:acyl-CoA synthetase (AMP-forming)/AMP-acid ligase II